MTAAVAACRAYKLVYVMNMRVKKLHRSCVLLHVLWCLSRLAFKGKFAGSSSRVT